MVGYVAADVAEMMRTKKGVAVVITARKAYPKKQEQQFGWCSWP